MRICQIADAMGYIECEEERVAGAELAVTEAAVQAAFDARNWDSRERHTRQIQNDGSLIRSLLREGKEFEANWFSS